MPKAPRQETSSTPFPFVRQFTAPPFFVDIDDAKRKSQLLLDAVQHAAPVEQKTPAKRKSVKQPKRPAAPAKKSGAGKGSPAKKR
jgi:hypothetical protein